METSNAVISSLRERVALLDALDVCYFPIPPRTKSAEGCGGWKKYQTSRPPRERVAAWIEKVPNNNLVVMCGAVSGNLFVIDCDNRETAAIIQAELDTREIKTFTVQTARGAHYYFRGPYPVRGCNLKLMSLTAEIRGAGQYVVSPLSIHPDGPVYTPNNETIKKLTDFNELSFLGVLFQIEKPFQPGTCSGELPPGAYRRLTGRLNDGATKSETEQKVIYQLHALGWSRDRILSAFERHAAPGSRYKTLKAESEKRANEYFAVSYSSAVKYHAINDGEAIKTRLMTVIDCLPPVKLQATVKAVLQAILQAGIKWETLKPPASQRWLAEQSGTSRPAVQHAVKVLLQAGILTSFKRERRSTRYTLNPSFVSNVSQFTQVNGVSIGKEMIQRDAFSWGVLNKTGYYLLQRIIQERDILVRELVRSKIAGRVTVYRKIALLQRAGIVGLERGMVHLLVTEPDEIRVKLDSLIHGTRTAGRAERLAVKHQMERAERVRRINALNETNRLTFQAGPVTGGKSNVLRKIAGG